MLGVVGERFPKGGALAMGAMGGIGMLSAGMLGSPGIGYTQDRFASKELRSVEFRGLCGGQVGSTESIFVLSAGRRTRRHQGCRASER